MTRASPWAESRPSGHPDVMNALDSALGRGIVVFYGRPDSDLPSHGRTNALTMLGGLRAAGEAQDACFTMEVWKPLKKCLIVRN